MLTEEINMFSCMLAW